jgi:4-coumarate--CoA ligase
LKENPKTFQSFQKIQTLNMCSYNPETKVVSGLKSRPIYAKSVTLGRVLMERLELFPNRIVQFCHDDQIPVSARAMSLLSIRAAQNLWKYGIDIGDVVGIVAKNTTFLTPIILGSFIIGAPVNPLDVKFSKTEIIHIFGITKPKIVFCDYEVLDLVKECLWELENSSQVVSLNKKVDGYQFVFDFFDRVSNERAFV